jgi:hypothetical protein
MPLVSPKRYATAWVLLTAGTPRLEWHGNCQADSLNYLLLGTLPTRHGPALLQSVHADILQTLTKVRRE